MPASAAAVIPTGCAVHNLVDQPINWVLLIGNRCSMLDAYGLDGDR
jgi:hypothetical protein